MAAQGKGDIVGMDYVADGEDDDVVGRSEADLQFDATIGHIEDVLISDDFQRLQDKFLESNYKYFDADDENKLEYTKIHQNYIDTVESHLEQMLKKRITGFSMERFAEQLVNRNREELEGDVFDVLLTFSDFVAFREMMIDYGVSRSGAQIDLCVTGRNAVSLGLVGQSIGSMSLQGVSKSATLQTLKAKHATASASGATRGSVASAQGSAPAKPSQAQLQRTTASSSASTNARRTVDSAKSASTSGLQRIDLSVKNTSTVNGRQSAASSSKPTKTPAQAPAPASAQQAKGSTAKGSNGTTKPK